MTKTRKTLTLLVTVSVPRDVGARDACEIARLAIANGIELNHGLSEGMRLRAVRTAAPVLAAAAKAELAWGKPRYPKPSPKAKTPPLLEAMGEK